MRSNIHVSLEKINQQSATIRSTSSTKQNKLICQLRTNTRLLAPDRQTTTATHPGTTATTKHAVLLSTYHHLRVAQLNNRRRNLYNTTLEAPGTQPLAMLLCGFSWRSNRSHYYLLLVLVMRAVATSISMCVRAYRNSINKCTTMIPTAVPWGFFYSNFIICFGTKYDSNLEVISCQVFFINLSIHQDPKSNWRVPFRM